MKISYKWLYNYFGNKLPAPEKLADLFAMHFSEVEEIIYRGKGLESVVVGLVLEKKKHPNADRLSVVKVDVSKANGGVLEIVCGAPNIDIGQKVPVALVGANLPGDFKIEKREVRGIVSNGMVCSEKEMGLANESAGIMVLDKKAKIGEKIADVLNLNDAVFDLKILPDRAHDCLSHIGVAREAAAILKTKPVGRGVSSGWGHASFSKVLPRIGKSMRKVSFEIKESKLCGRYIGRIIENVRATASPLWMKQYLESVGQRSINNIVDASNFIMLDMGQPTHAFDADKIKGAKIIVRRAKNGEKIETLDGQVKDLDEGILVIADAEGPVAIAGVMGGKRTAVDENTKNIILEAANFDQTSVRKTSRKLGLRTESSIRFENGISPVMADWGMDWLTEVICENRKESVIGAKKDIYPAGKKTKTIRVEFAVSDVANLLGAEIKEKEIIDILTRLNFKVKKSKKSLVVDVPPERLDVSIKEDIIEEIGRIYGYEKIKPEMPVGTLVPAKRNDNYFYASMCRDILIGAGFSEIYTYSFSDKGEIELQNPIDKNKKFMRTELLNGLHRAAKMNANNNVKNIKIFEIGKIFPAGGETISVAGLVNNGSFYEIKGMTETLLEKMGLDDYYFENLPDRTEPRDGAADIRVGNTSLGVIDNGGFEINFEMLVKVVNEELEYRPISKYPAADRDVAVFVPADTRMQEVEDVIQNAAGSYLIDVDLFDIFEQDLDVPTSEAGDENDKDLIRRKSLAFHLIFQSQDETLSDEQINLAMHRIHEALEANDDWEVRK